jgi:hypothetical protein
MRKMANGDVPGPSGSRSDSFGSIVSDLEALVTRIRASIELVDAAIEQEPSAGDPEFAANVVVLDDITPRYAKVTAALSACSVSLDAALQFMRDAGAPGLRAAAATGHRRTTVD